MEEHKSLPIKGVLNKLSIKDLNISGKTLFIRVDFNVPFDENMNITDDRRIRSALATINYAIDEGSKIILASHLGSPKGKVDKNFTLASVARRLQRLVKKEVTFIPNCVGPEVEEKVSRMVEGAEYEARVEDAAAEAAFSIGVLCPGFFWALLEQIKIKI